MAPTVPVHGLHHGHAWPAAPTCTTLSYTVARQCRLIPIPLLHFSLPFSSGDSPCTLPSSLFHGLVYLLVLNEFDYNFTNKLLHREEL
ncbi:hypothetical protein PanWU01x14_362690 [Parasponia andersonii]|uniref:Uncharacterized protein n=1 Tax=Parasponia andersonii TaxID=3476 RepID=A0A2P5A6W0_PARAD|nr:hypothetical protein PanWU01x14_362690 [Parasponia andersonii]